MRDEGREKIDEGRRTKDNWRGQIKAGIHIFDWLESVVVLPILLYRRLRYGYVFRRLRMAQPRYAKVDPADYKRLRKYEWVAQKIGRSCYARRRIAGGKKSRGSLVYLHQEILKVPKGKVIDHSNNDGMDNRMANLRAATPAQNMRNRKKYDRKSSSKYKGVHWYKHYSKWAVSIRIENKRIFLGYFASEIEAAKAYDEAAKKYHGEFACLNFPESE